MEPPRELFADRRLTLGDKAVAAVLWYPVRFGDESPRNWRTRRAIADELGLDSDSGVRKSIARLAACGWIERVGAQGWRLHRGSRAPNVAADPSGSRRTQSGPSAPTVAAADPHRGRPLLSPAPMVADNRPHTGPGGVQEGPQSAPIVPPEFPTVGTHHHDDHRGAGDDPRVRRMARADLTLRRIYEAVTPVEAQHGGKRLGMFSRKEGETLDGVAAALDVHPPEHVIEVAVSRARAVLRGECDPKLWRFLFRDNGFEAARQAHESAQTRTQRRADEAAERAGPSVDQCISPEQIATLREGAGFLRGSG